VIALSNIDTVFVSRPLGKGGELAASIQENTVIKHRLIIIDDTHL
jgi:hypothetical protein